MIHLLQELKDTQDVEHVLMQNRDLIDHDPDLAQVYQELGFSQSLQSFPSPPARDLVLSMLEAKECKSISLDLDLRKEDDWDVHRSLKLDPDYQCLDVLGNEQDLGLSAEFPEFTEELGGDINWGQQDSTVPLPVKPQNRDQSVPRATKGLKKLSTAVKALVSEYPSITYKEVATRLIRNMDKLDAEKEEKNVRRRVYDALNVLIAAEVLTKHGKEVRLVPELKTISHSNLPEEARKRLLAKQTHLIEVTEQYKRMHALIDRNRKQPKTDRIGFPFVILATRKSQVRSTQILIQSDSFCSGLKIKLNQTFKLIGDLHMVSQLRTIPSESISLPPDLQRLLSELSA